MSNRVKRLAGRLSQISRAVRMPVIYRNWVTAYRNRFEIRVPQGIVRYYLRSGASLTMQAGEYDVRIVNEIWLDRAYEPTHDFVVRNGWTVLDVGANKGAFTVRAALSGPETKVFAVEPEPNNITYLRENIAANDLSNVHVIEGAVGTHSGEGVLYLGDRSRPGDHSIVAERDQIMHREPNETVQERTIAVKIVQLEEIVAQSHFSVDLLKLDVEGAEREILLSANPDVLTSIKRVALEYHAIQGMTAASVAWDIQNKLEGCGFRCFRAANRPLLFATRVGGNHFST